MPWGAQPGRLSLDVANTALIQMREACEALCLRRARRRPKATISALNLGDAAASLEIRKAFMCTARGEPLCACAGTWDVQAFFRSALRAARGSKAGLLGVDLTELLLGASVRLAQEAALELDGHREPASPEIAPIY